MAVATNQTTNGDAGSMQSVATLAQLSSLAALGALNPNTTYVVSSTGEKYWATNSSTYTSAGRSLDVSNVSYVEAGLLVPESGTIAAAALSGGVAYIGGNRVVLGATPLTFIATRDNYVDVNRNGVVTVTSVTVAAAAPVLAANSIRLGFSRTDAMNVTLRTIQAFDSLGNWMYNTVSVPMCKITRASATGYGGAAIVLPFPDVNTFDNANLHNPSVDNSRVTFPASGAYYIDCVVLWFAAVTPISSYTLAPRLNGTLDDASFPLAFQGTQATQSMRCSGIVHARAGDYLEMVFTPNGATGAVDASRLHVIKVQ